ncbi:hypothetical protein TRAPUB_9548 [Trametes pubescens]|uniref:Uncharacterized protein n=1 Tax=Trametes pubescens TaxID=154538 RepID=A0A1M2W1Y9_TRAPU|nr:hypothetical protein TRAPUB_9548 [Trametes pubescens]
MSPRKCKTTDDNDLSTSDSKRKHDETPDHSDATLDSQPSPPTGPISEATAPASSNDTVSVMDNTNNNGGDAAHTPPAAIVAVIDLDFLPTEVDYVPNSIIPCVRLLAILNFSDATANWFAIGLAPDNMDWGAAGTGSGLDKYLCVGGRPVTLWMLGIAGSVWLTPTDGTWVSLGLRLICRCDQEVTRRILYDRCQPPADVTTASSLTYANRFLGGHGESGPSSFQDVYDTSDMLEAWSSMTRIPSDRVRKTDIVLVECYVRRFKSRENTNRYTWQSWGVNFKLLRIAHILRGPSPTELVPEDSAVSF